MSTPAARKATARRRLRNWGASYARRDELVKQGSAAGLSIAAIAELTGLAKTTVFRILGGSSKPRVVCNTVPNEPQRQAHEAESSTL